MERPARDRPELLALPNGIATGRILLRRYRPGDGASNERDHHGRLRDTLIFGLAVFEFDAWVNANGLPGIEYLNE